MFRLVKASAAGACILLLPLVVLSCGKPSSPASTVAAASAQAAASPKTSAAAPSAPAASAAPTAPARGAAGAAPTPAAAPQKTLPGLPAEVIYTSGDVQAQRQGGGWSDLEIGAKLQNGDAVRVGAASECQLKLADLAVVSIRENTQVSVDSLALGDSVAQARIGLKTGTVLSKVKKLAGNDSYSVRTDTAVGGVRGTEFGVTVTPQGGTLVTVKDGTVAVLPAAYDPDELRALSASAPEVDRIARDIEKSAAQVRAGQEITVTPQQAARAEKDFQAIRVAVALIVKERQTIATAQIATAQASAAKTQSSGSAQAAAGAQSAGSTTPPPSASIETQMKSIQAATAALASLVGTPRIMTPAHEQALQRLQSLPAPGAPAGRTSSTPPAATANPAVTPVHIVVSADPPDSDIEIDGKPAATGSYAADVNPGNSLTLVIRHEGYATKTLALTAKGPANYPVQLDPAPIEASFAPGSAPLVGAVQASGDLLISTDRQGQVAATDRSGRVRWKIATQNTPNENSSAVIAGDTLYFTGSKEFIVASVQTGQVAGRVALDSATTHLFGQRVAVSGSLGAYPTSSSIMIFDPATGAAIRQIPVAGGTLMTPAISGGRVFVVSQAGVFLAADPQSGLVLFQVPTGASQPVAGSVLVAGTRALFADRKGLVVCVDLQGRKVLWKVPLKGSGSRGVFQDLEKSANGVLVFAGDTIYAFSAADGSELFPPIAGASTPPLDRDGKLYFGTRDGALAIADDRTGKIMKSLDMKAALSTRPQPDGPRLLLGGAAGQVFVVYPGSIP